MIKIIEAKITDITLNDIVNAKYDSSMMNDRAEIHIGNRDYVKIGKNKWEYHGNLNSVIGSTYTDKEIYNMYIINDNNESDYLYEYDYSRSRRIDYNKYYDPADTRDTYDFYHNNSNDDYYTRRINNYNEAVALNLPIIKGWEDARYTQCDECKYKIDIMSSRNDDTDSIACSACRTPGSKCPYGICRKDGTGNVIYRDEE